MAQENNVPLSKKGKREISPFIGHELLYDYLTGSLDKDRRLAVEDHVKFSRDAQLDLTKIQNGQAYAEKLADTVVSQHIIGQINAPSSYMSVLMQKSNFDKWPQGLKWGLEALVVVVGIVVLLSITPWQKVMELSTTTGSKEVVLAEVSKTGTSTTVEDQPQFVDEGVKENSTPAPAAPVQDTAKPTTSPSPTVAAKKAAPTEESSAATSPAAGGGFLYRGDIAVTNIEVIGPKITDKINELGGRKAGAVELGWKKTATSMYYHFTIPEAKYQDLMNFLGTYGKPKISKEKHPRVMPDGIVRLIITVDEAKK
ncbi:hypothetical protein ACLWBD_00930 [Bdellovibrio sp. HCB117]|uniref:Uncharacterized protein n=1 Tax=Bdellovibrio bacteriovorus TaxID=959 RepID=A0A150WCN6_BDEBC|nr:hypothetical protein [Bdellovibrio bacteriovorus]KYG60669.1 hypothetical protein AZI85_11770 [Bdellovibrio bacteriovorus]